MRNDRSNNLNSASWSTTSASGRRRRGFTLIELMVVVAIIGLLTTLVTVSGPVVFDTHRQIKTNSIMRSTEIAIDQFAELDPLRSMYNSPSRRTFGRFPAYTLFNHEDAARSNAAFIQTVIEPSQPFPQDIQVKYEFALRGRLANDLFSSNIDVDDLEDSSDDLLSIDDEKQNGEDAYRAQRLNDDMRALYAYLAAYVPDALEAIPQSSRLPLTDPDYNDDQGEFFNPTGNADDLESRIPILGIVDAWGVPLDYHVMFKLRYTMTNDGLVGWTVADRRPVLRSQGTKPERLEQALDGEEVGSENGNKNQRAASRERWIYSRPMPNSAMPVKAFANDRNTGRLEAQQQNVVPPNRYDGWVRGLAGVGDDISDSYSWVPLTESE